MKLWMESSKEAKLKFMECIIHPLNKALGHEKGSKEYLTIACALRYLAEPNNNIGEKK